MAKTLRGLHLNPTFESLALEGKGSTYDFENLEIPGRSALNLARGFFSPLDPSGELHPVDLGHDDRVEKAVAQAQAMAAQFEALLEDKKRKLKLGWMLKKCFCLPLIS